MKAKQERKLARALVKFREFLSLNWVRDSFMYFIRIVERMDENHIFLSAAGLSFNALLCFIPLVLLVFFALGFYLGTEDAIVAVDRYILELGLFPYEREQLRSIVVNLIREFVKGSNIAGIVGALGLTYTSSALFASLRTVLGKIFHMPDTKNIFASKLRDFALLSIVGIAGIIVTVFMYGVSVLKSLGQRVFSVELEAWLFNDVFTAIAPFLLSFLLFILVFTIVPEKRLHYRVILLASSIAALLWGFAKIIFAYYLQNLWEIGAVYGPYAIVVATALWVFYSSLALLFAAEVGQMRAERMNLRSLFTEHSLKGIVERSRSTKLTFTTSASAEKKSNHP